MRQFGGQPFQGPFAGRVQLERRRDERGAFGVDDDAGDLSAADQLAQVVIAQRCGVRPAALLGFLRQAFADLRGQVGRVELGHDGVDAFHQPAGGGFFQPFGHRHQRDSGAAQRGADGDVVFDVAREPVDLVDHDGVHVAVLSDPRQHGLQLRAVGGAGGLATVGVFVGDGPALVADVAHARFALGGQREALFGQVAVGLAFGRHAQIDHAAHLRFLLAGVNGTCRRPGHGRGVKAAVNVPRGVQQRRRQRPQRRVERRVVTPRLACFGRSGSGGCRVGHRRGGNGAHPPNPPRPPPTGHAPPEKRRLTSAVTPQ